jgi:hypothetical protein
MREVSLGKWLRRKAGNNQRLIPCVSQFLLKKLL